MMPPVRAHRDWRVLLRGALAVALATVATPLAAQNLIVEGSWQGFAMRNPEGKFDRCVLYNRTVEALNASPFDMLGLTRDGSGGVGLIAFFQPRTLTRATQTAVTLKIDAGAPTTRAGTVLSDFHVAVPGPLDDATVTALRAAKAIEITAESKMIRFEVTELGAVLDRLSACVAMYGK